MGNLSFCNWLYKEESQNNIEIQVARFLEDTLEKAANLKKQDLQLGNYVSFSEYVKRVWPQDSIQGYNLLLPNTFPPDIAGRPVRFRIQPLAKSADTVHTDGRFEGFNINMLKFNMAKTPQEVDDYLEHLKSTMHHEAEHIYNTGDDYDIEDYEGDDKHRMAMQYLNNPGELRAHARQMAYLYAKHFPNQPFDLTKAQSILDKPGFTNSHKNYFQQLADPKIWEKQVQKFGYKNTNPHNEIMALVPQFLSQYQ